MTRQLTPAERATLHVLRAISRELAAASVPVTKLCPVDGCLLRIKEKCPACKAATQPRLCTCGTRIRRRDADKCHDCRVKVPGTRCAGCSKQVRKPGEVHCHECRAITAPRPQCACGRQIRAAGQTACSPCRRKERDNTIPDDTDTCPVRWIRRGLIWHPVYEQSEVA